MARDSVFPAYRAMNDSSSGTSYQRARAVLAGIRPSSVDDTSGTESPSTVDSLQPSSATKDTPKLPTDPALTSLVVCTRSFAEVSVLPARPEMSNFRKAVLSGSALECSVVALPPTGEVSVGPQVDVSAVGVRVVWLDVEGSGSATAESSSAGGMGDSEIPAYWLDA